MNSFQSNQDKSKKSGDEFFDANASALLRASGFQAGLLDAELPKSAGRHHVETGWPKWLPWLASFAASVLVFVSFAPKTVLKEPAAPIHLADTKKNEKVEKVEKPELPRKGEAVTVACIADKNQKYVCYLPKKYDAGKVWPILYCFAPDADGGAFVKLFSPECEKLGWIIAASLNAQNGPQEPIIESARAMAQDTAERFNLSPSMRFATGFSGGAAMSFIMTETEPSAFSGVFGIGGSIPTWRGMPSKELDMFFACGDKDDFVKDKVFAPLIPNLKKLGYSVEFELFKGGHEMPDAASVKKALLWLDGRALEKQSARCASILKEAEVLSAKGEKAGAWLLLAKEISGLHHSGLNRKEADAVFGKLAKDAAVKDEKSAFDEYQILTHWDKARSSAFETSQTLLDEAIKKYQAFLRSHEKSLLAVEAAERLHRLRNMPGILSAKFELNEAQKNYCRETAPKAKEGLLKACREFITQHVCGDEQRTAFKLLIDAWFPETFDGAGDALAYGVPEGESGRFLQEQSKTLSRLAEDALKLGMGSTAGVEAYRALGFDPANETALKILGYEKTNDGWQIPAERLKLESGKVKSEFGWLSKDMIEKRGKDKFPEGEKWLDAKESQNLHPDWSKPRQISHTFFHLWTDLPAEEAFALGRRLDWYTFWLRARFFNVPGYQDPEPLNIYVIAKDKDYSDYMKKILDGKEGGSPFGVSWYPTRPFVMVNAELCDTKSAEKAVGIAQHELSHAFFSKCFPGGKITMNTHYGWMVEAFPAWIYYVSPNNPADGDYWRVLCGKCLNNEARRKEVKRVADGENVIGELNDIPKFSDASHHLQAYLAGAMFSKFAFESDELREGYARFCVKALSYSAVKGDFEALVGDPAKLSRQMGEWFSKLPKE